MWDSLLWIARYYRRHLYVLFVLVVMTPVQAMFAVSVPRMIDFTVDYLDTGRVTDHFLARTVAGLGAGLGLTPQHAFGLGFIAIGLIATALYAYVQSHRAWMNCRLEWAFRQEAFDKITFRGPDFFNKFRTGDLVTRLTDDVAEKLSWFACSGIFRLYEALTIVTFTLIMMVSIDPMLTLWAAGPLPVLILIFFRTSSLLDRRYDHLQSRISLFNDVMEACFSGVRVVKAYVLDGAMKGKFGAAAIDRRNAEISSIRTSTIVDSMYMYIWQFALLVVLTVGGYMVMQADLSRGQLGTFIFYATWLVFPMFDIGQFLVKSRQSAVSIHRLLELDSVPPMVTENGALALSPTGPLGVSFERVEFGFGDKSRKILNDISLDIQPRQTVALVGRVGSGKSWLINLIPRLVDPTSGRVTAGGHDVRHAALADLRGAVGYVPQEPVLFSDTIRNNILLGRSEISESLLEWAVEVAQLKDEIAGFPKGMDTFVGTRGMSISGGQKQRLGLARALVGKPRILVLDDCTSALDSRTEAALWERLHEVLPDMTAILITHRPDTLEKADQIYVLEGGRVVESGRHADLIKGGGEYARIYRRYKLEELVQ